MRFVDDLCAINGGGDFAKSFREIYPPGMELKIDHKGTDGTFIDLDIYIVDDRLVYKLYDKLRNFNFFIDGTPKMCIRVP